MGLNLRKKIVPNIPTHLKYFYVAGNNKQQYCLDTKTKKCWKHPKTKSNNYGSHTLTEYNRCITEGHWVKLNKEDIL